jgi:hypothetical protein
LLNCAIHHRQNKTRSRKNTRVKTTCGHSVVSRADWCHRLAEVWPWPPHSFSFTEAVTATVWELSDRTSYS